MCHVGVGTSEGQKRAEERFPWSLSSRCPMQRLRIELWSSQRRGDLSAVEPSLHSLTLSFESVSLIGTVCRRGRNLVLILENMHFMSIIFCF